ncbi:TonB-dependent siderophore receptor [Lewinella sp. 4G2]|uniref:TonB-dependent receptor plug domain-containing protein n=1 Tax=Lewinella sp. 4G2 TaxID=1803372 RepID=UPI0007B4C8E6|nr:TonB-dependent receptor plug domain-containing protein [Lewinella sp. 4G2]OAV42820.1 hypothetical protein A3850_016440 [Lewinella sp. 4G2]
MIWRLFALVLFCLSGSLTGQDSLSFGGSYDLPGAEVRAEYKAVSPLAQRFTIEEVYRLPGTFYDPARLVALLPGVVQTNDQANHLSVRGNSPNKNLWRLNGLAIVNPNHTANAGTFYDFPTLNGGGVNAISAQMLDNSGFYAGGLPVEYGNATGGTFDLQLRPGSKIKHRQQVQAGFIGFDLAAEGPIDRAGRISYLVNGRYSFTGLLGDAGVDFGGEEIRFADVNAHLHYGGERSSLSVFSILGQSSNKFLAPDPEENDLEEQKELFDIDFNSGLFIVGADYAYRGKSSVFKLGVAHSVATPERRQSLREGDFFIAESIYDQRHTSARVTYDYALNDELRLLAGTEVLLQQVDGLTVLNSLTSTSQFANLRNLDQTSVSPYLGVEYQKERLELSAGLRHSIYEAIGAIDVSFTEPRLSFSYLGDGSRTTLAAEINSMLYVTPLLIQQLTASIVPEAAYQTQQLLLSHANKVGPVQTKITGFFQRTPDEVAARDGEFLVSANNLLEPISTLSFTESANTRRFGVELEVGGGRKSDGWYYRGSLTLLSAQTQQDEGDWADDRYAADYIGKLTLGREWAGMDKKERDRTYGLNLALIAHGGERYGRVEASENEFTYFAPTNLSEGFILSTGTYFRPDLRLYKTKVRAKTTTTLALDVQNVASIQNVGNVYYDALLERPNDRFQLGIIPVLSYRIAW